MFGFCDLTPGVSIRVIAIMEIRINFGIGGPVSILLVMAMTSLLVFITVLLRSIINGCYAIKHQNVRPKKLKSV